MSILEFSIIPQIENNHLLVTMLFLKIYGFFFLLVELFVTKALRKYGRPTYLLLDCFFWQHQLAVPYFSHSPCTLTRQREGQRLLKLLIQGVWRNISASNSRVSLLHLSLQFVSQWPYLWLCYSISKPWLCHFSQVHLSVTFSSCGIHNQEEKVTTWLVTLTLVWQYDVVLHWLVYKSNIKEK